MARLAAVIDSLDGIAEPLHEFYTQVDGKYVLDADIEAHPQTEGLRKTAKDRRREREEVERELKVYKDLGMSVEDIAAMREQLEKSKTPDDKPDLDKLRKKWADEIRKEFEPSLKELEAIRNENRTLKLDDKLTQDFLAAGGRKQDIDLMLKDTRSRFDLSDKGVPIVVDEDGDALATSPKDWFANEYKNTRPNLFEGTGAAGGGAQGGRSGGSGADADVRKLPGARMVESAFAGGATK